MNISLSKSINIFDLKHNFFAYLLISSIYMKTTYSRLNSIDRKYIYIFRMNLLNVKINLQFASKVENSTTVLQSPAWEILGDQKCHLIFWVYYSLSNLNITNENGHLRKIYTWITKPLESLSLILSAYWRFYRG